MTRKTVLREVLAGAVGYVIFIGSAVLLFQLSGYDPFALPTRSFQLFSILYGIGFAFIAGYLTAMLSPASPIRPAIFVSLLIAIGALLSLLMQSHGERWSQLAALLLMAPMVLVGARARHRRLVKQGASNG